MTALISVILQEESCFQKLICSHRKTEVMNLLESAGFSRANPYCVVQQGKVSCTTSHWCCITACTSLRSCFTMSKWRACRHAHQSAHASPAIAACSETFAHVHCGQHICSCWRRSWPCQQ